MVLRFQAEAWRSDEMSPRESCPGPTQAAVCLQLLRRGPDWNNGTLFLGAGGSASYTAQGWQRWTALSDSGPERFLDAGPGFPRGCSVDARAPGTVTERSLACITALLSPCRSAETWSLNLLSGPTRIQGKRGTSVIRQFSLGLNLYMNQS